MAKGTNWIALEVDYRSGSASNRELAARYGTSEGTIRRRAKAGGWTKGAADAKRERVKAHLAGASDQDIEKGVQAATDADVADMELGLSNARKALQVVGAQLDNALNPEDPEDRSGAMLVDTQDLKRLSETNKINVDVIRKIRGLDEPNQDDNRSAGAYTIDDVLRERAKLLEDF